MRAFFFTILSILLTAGNVHACAVCFNNVDNDQNIVALKWSMITLLLFITFVLILFAKFFLTLRKNEKLLIQKTGSR